MLIKQYNPNFELVQINDKHILKIDCMKSKKPVFLKFHKEEEFYIRIGAATIQATGSKLVNYINNNFRNFHLLKHDQVTIERRNDLKGKRILVGCAVGHLFTLAEAEKNGYKFPNEHCNNRFRLYW